VKTEYPTLRFEKETATSYLVYRGDLPKHCARVWLDGIHSFVAGVRWTPSMRADFAAFMAQLEGKEERLTQNIYAVYEADNIFSLTIDAGLVYDGPVFRGFKIVVDAETYNLLEAWMKDHGGYGSVNIPLNGGSHE
jgi:hypothetical protein